MHPYRQVFLGDPVTPATALRRTAGVNRDIRSTSICSFVARIGCELVPCGIRNAFRQAVILDHPRDRQVLKYDNAELGHQATAQLVREVLAPMRNSFVDAPHNALVILVFGRAFGVLTHPSLRPRKRLFIHAKEAWIGDGFTTRQGSELL